MQPKGPRILIVGSGAVGAVFGEHLTRAGAQVGFLVRNPDSANARMPRALHQLQLTGRVSRVHQMLPTGADIRGNWDQCWLCLPSTALTSDWLQSELEKLGPEVAILNWAPDPGDRARLDKRLARRVHRGLTGLVSYQAPLPGESEPADGIAYWLPPRSATLENTRLGRQVATLLKNGGMPASRSRNLPWLAARMTAVVITLMAALEIEDWSLERLRASAVLDTATGAAREAMAVAAASLGISTGWAARLPHNPIYRALLRGLPPLAPFSLETYLGYHFAKVGAQTRLMLDTWIEEGEQCGIDTPCLRQVRHALP